MELETLPDGGLVQDTDQFVVSRAGAARRVAGARFTRNDAAGNSQLAGDPRLTLGNTFKVGTRALLGADANYAIIYGGPVGTAFSNAANNAILLTIADSGAITAAGTLNVAGPIRQNGQQVWHTGNFNPAAYAPLIQPVFSGAVVQQDNPTDTATYYQLRTSGALRAYMAVDSAGMYLNSNRGPIFFQFNSFGPLITFNTNGVADFAGVRVGGQAVWHAGNFNPASYLPVSGTAANSALLSNVPARQYYQSGSYYIPMVAPDGVVEVGSIIDFHAIGSSADYDYRMSFANGVLSAVGPFNASGALTQGGNQVWHAGNLSPAAYAALSGATFTGGVSLVGGAAFAGVSGFSATKDGSNNPIITFGSGTLIGYNISAGFFDVTVGGTSIIQTRGSGVTVVGALAVRDAITQGGQQVWHAGNLNPSAYQPAGNYAVRSADVTFRDVTVSRGDGTGVVYFAGADTYVYYDGGNFVLSKAGVIVARINESEARFRGNVIGNLGSAV